MHTNMSVGKHEERTIARSASRCENHAKEVSRRAQGVTLSFGTVFERKIKQTS